MSSLFKRYASSAFLNLGGRELTLDSEKLAGAMASLKSLGHSSSSFQKPEYERLVSSEDSEDVTLSLNELHSQRAFPIRRCLIILVKLLLVLFAVIGTFSIPFLSSSFLRYIHSPSERFEPSLYPSCSCGGTTVAEAKARGCIFTPLSIAWLPPHCIDMELSNDFDKQGPGPNGEWDYWADENMTRRLTREETGMLADYDGVFYATQDWHVTHCLYTWQKHYRSKWTGVTIERRSNGLDHIGHCGGVFRIRGGLQDLATVAGIALDGDDPGETNL